MEFSQEIWLAVTFTASGLAGAYSYLHRAIATPAKFRLSMLIVTAFGSSLFGVLVGLFSIGPAMARGVEHQAVALICMLPFTGLRIKDMARGVAGIAWRLIVEQATREHGHRDQ